MGFEYSNQAGACGPTGNVRTYHVDSGHSTRLTVGDVVKATGTSHTDGVKEVDAATQGAAVVGVIAGIDFTLSGETLSPAGTLAASTAGTVQVITDPLALFEVECDETLSDVDVGLNADAAVTASTLSGGLAISNMVLDSSTKATTQTLHFNIVALLKGKTSGTLGDRALVRLNNCEVSDGAAGV